MILSAFADSFLNYHVDNIAQRVKVPMWLPIRVYESLPYAYVTGGLFFVAGEIYLGPGVSVAPLYLALGIISICSGILVFIKRRHVRNQNVRALSQSESE